MENNLNKLVCIETMQNTRVIDPAKVLYCHIHKKKTVVVLVNNEMLVTRCSLISMERQLIISIRLLRCHSKYLISLEHPLIYDSKNRTIELLNGEILPVAKDRKSTVKKTLSGSRMQS